jgi:hypothetical protein
VGINGNGQVITVTQDWTSLLDELKRQIQQGESVTVVTETATRKLTLTSGDSDFSFTIDALGVGVDVAKAVAATGVNPTTLAATGVAQVSTAALSSTYTPVSGDQVSLVLTDQTGT